MKNKNAYDISQASLERFVKKFNIVAYDLGIKMIPNDYESYDTDGYFVDLKTGKKISFDWTYRNRWYKTAGFPFKTLREWRRKLDKKGLEVFIHCSKDERAVCVAFREDYDKVKAQILGL